jgi:signal transduction histidine kinase
MPERRSVYFAFQGLFAAVLMLIFVYQYQTQGDWGDRFAWLVVLSGASLGVLQVSSLETLGAWWFQVALFVGDAGLATLLLRWTQPQSELYLIYFLVIFGTAITRNYRQSMVVAAVTSILYLVSSWHGAHGFPHDTAFWLRLLFLIISATLMAILSLDSQRAQAHQERRYRDRLIQVERLATLGQVAGEVAHQIKGPLTTIMVNAEVLSARHSKSKEMLKELGEIRDEVEHCKQILKGLLDLGRIEEFDIEKIDLRDPVRFAIKSVEPQIRRKELSLQVRGLDAPCRAEGDQSLLQEAVGAILQNAVDASHKGGEIRLTLEKEKRYAWSKSGAPNWRIVIEDDGAGMSEEQLERVFEPFYTTKGKDGTGLGLSAAVRILQKHRGAVDAQSRGPGRGSRFTLTLPRRVRA